MKDMRISDWLRIAVLFVLISPLFYGLAQALLLYALGVVLVGGYFGARKRDMKDALYWPVLAVCQVLNRPYK
jgi:hypothetical protein